MKWYRRVQECTYVRGSDDVIAIITSQTGWLCIFRRGGCAGAVPHDEEGVESQCSVENDLVLMESMIK